MIIDLAEYLERRRRTTAERIVRMAVGRCARESIVKQGTRSARSQSGRAIAVRWSGLLPVVPALELAALYADASLI